MSRDPSARYYQQQKKKKKEKKLQKRARERNKYLSEEEKEKVVIWSKNDIKTSLNMKKPGWLSIGKVILKCMKRLILKLLVSNHTKCIE